MSAIAQPNFRSRYATSLTRTGKIDMTNRKPYRTPELMKRAKDEAEKVNGTFYAHKVPTLFSGKVQKDF